MKHLTMNHHKSSVSSTITPSMNKHHPSTMQPFSFDSVLRTFLWSFGFRPRSCTQRGLRRLSATESMEKASPLCKTILGTRSQGRRRRSTTWGELRLLLTDYDRLAFQPPLEDECYWVFGPIALQQLGLESLKVLEIQCGKVQPLSMGQKQQISAINHHS